MRRCFFARAWHCAYRSAHRTRSAALGAGPREIGPPRAGWDSEKGPPGARGQVLVGRFLVGWVLPVWGGQESLGLEGGPSGRGAGIGGGGPWGAGPRAGSGLQGGSWRGRFLGARGGDWRRVLGVRVLWAARAGVLRSSRARPLKSPRRAASPARAAAVRPAPRPESAGWDRGPGGGRRPLRFSGAPGAGRGRRRG